jgi:hypothetical protein
MKRCGEALTRGAVFLGLMVGCSGGDGAEEAQPERAATASEALVARPKARLVLTDAVVERLQQRAKAGDAAWVALESRCSGYAAGSVYAPNGNAYPGYPNVGQGYQGEEYLPVIRALGLCYRAATDEAA